MILRIFRRRYDALRFVTHAAGALGLLAASSALAQESAVEIEADSRVAAALVYPRGATIERIARFVAPAGRHEIVIADLPVALDKDSIRVAGTASLAGADQSDAFEILGVSHKIKKPRVAPLSEPERQALLDEIEELQWDLRSAEDEIAEARDRLSYMSEFRTASVGGRPPYPFPAQRRKKAPTQPNVDRPLHGPGSGRAGASLFEYSAQWPEAWSLISSESAAARGALRKAEREKKRLSKAIASKRDQLERVGPPPPARGVLTVSIRATAPVSAGALKVSYLTSKARWTPLYDLKLSSDGVDKPGLEGALTLIRRASVVQNTGEDWDNVRLRLSSARPRGRVSMATPRSIQAVLAPTPEDRARARRDLSEKLMAGAAQSEADYAQTNDLINVLPAQKPAAPAAEAVAIAEEPDAVADFSSAGVVYAIPDPAVIPGDGEARQVRISEEESKVALVARAAPAREQTAYLYALYEISKAPLLPGRASIYRDGVFYGQTRLSAAAPGDETALPFGPLDEVKVSFRIINRSNKTEGLITTSNKREARFAFTARNLGGAPRKITLFDARPFTETEEIAVRRTGDKPTEEEIDGRRGVLSWTFDLGAGAERTVNFGYDISWPEGRRMQLRR